MSDNTITQLENNELTSLKLIYTKNTNKIYHHQYNILMALNNHVMKYKENSNLRDVFIFDDEMDTSNVLEPFLTYSTTLDSLYIRTKTLCGSIIKTILMNNKNLHTLELSTIYVFHNPNDFYEGLKHCTFLHTLELHNVYRAISIQSALSSLQHNKNLKSLNISGNNLGKQIGTIIPLLKNHKFDYLNLGINGIKDLMMLKNIQVKKLILFNNLLDLKSLIPYFTKDRVLEKLNLSYCRGICPKYLVPLLRTTTTLKELILTQVKIKNDVLYLAKALKHNKSLEELDIQSCQIDDIKCFKPYFQKTKTLYKLVIDGNYFLDSELHDAIKYNQSIYDTNNEFNYDDNIVHICNRNKHNICQKNVTLYGILQ